MSTDRTSIGLLRWNQSISLRGRTSVLKWRWLQRSASTHLAVYLLDILGRVHLHFKTSHSIGGSTESAKRNKDNSEPSLFGTAETASTSSSFWPGSEIGTTVLGFRLLCKILPRFIPRMQWLLISLRISGSALFMLVEMTNGIAAADWRAKGQYWSIAWKMEQVQQTYPNYPY